MYFFTFEYYLLFILGHVGGCGITDEIVKWMESIQNSGVEDESVSSPPPSPTPQHSPSNSSHGSPQPAATPTHPNSLRDDLTR